MAIYIIYHPDDGETFARTLHFEIRAHAHVDAIMSDGGQIDSAQPGDLVLVVGTAFAHGSSFIAFGISQAREAGAVIHWITPDDHGLTNARRLAQDHLGFTLIEDDRTQRERFGDDTRRGETAVMPELEEEGGDPDRGMTADELERLRDEDEIETEVVAPSPARPSVVRPVPPPAPITPPIAPPTTPPTTLPEAVPPQPAPTPAPGAIPTMDAKAADPIQFSGYYPVEVKPDDWQPLRAYVFRERAARDVERDVERELGGLLAGMRRVVDAARGAISEGALISAEPQLEGFQFNPPVASVAFFEDWHRFDFKLRAHTAKPYASVNGRITFRVEGIIVADLPLSIYVSPQAGATLSAGRTAATASPYRAIFCSYSHRDTPIILRVEKVIRTLGDNFLRDATTLRSGEDWNAGLLDMIDRADIFQLFWSTAASKSKYVRQEWEYALARMQREAIASFIRPVYWEEPMPPPPEELGHLHFAHDPTLDD